MSLDVYLTGEKTVVRCVCSECDNVHERTETENFYSANITHNLGEMAEEAGIYKHLWRPEELGITKAKELIEPLKTGLAIMRSNPARFEKLNSTNGWGLYKNFIPWIRKYLDACIEYPNANIHVSR